MAILKPFRGIRPQKDKAALVASRPYDVLNKEEARIEARGNPFSFLHVIKPEMDLPDTIHEYDPRVYDQGRDYFKKLKSDGVFFDDPDEYLYVYGQTMNGKTQYGLVGCAAVSDYLNSIIKKHELTRPDKEEDRKNHVRVSQLHYEPVFFAYQPVPDINAIIQDVIREEPEYNFTATDGFGHHFWVIRNKETIGNLVELFRTKVPFTYVADGHHRTAAAALVGEEKSKQNPNHTGNEEYNYFLAVHFPSDQLSIIDYNRVVKDLNGHSPDQILQKLEVNFRIEKRGKEIYKPEKLHSFAMYLNEQWYKLEAKPETYDDNDPIRALDVTVLSTYVLADILDIQDLRKSKRIDFIGGIRGLDELKHRVDSGEMAIAFALYPVSMKQLMDIADSNQIMPPKTTWFEPKLRSGLVIHSFE